MLDKGDINNDNQGSSFEVLSIKIQSTFGNSNMTTSLLNRLSTVKSIIHQDVVQHLIVCIFIENFDDPIYSLIPKW